MLFYSLIAGAVMLFALKIRYDVRRAGRTNTVLQDYYDLQEKLLEMDNDPTIDDKDFLDILPVCEFVDKQMGEILKIKAYKKIFASQEFQKLADIVRQRIEG